MNINSLLSLGQNNGVPLKLTVNANEPESYNNLRNSHEEADTIMIHDILNLSKVNENGTILADVMTLMYLYFCVTLRMLTASI